MGPEKLDLYSMSNIKMHDDEIDIDVALTKQLPKIAISTMSESQHTPVESAGTDNAIFRLGSEKNLLKNGNYLDQIFLEWHLK
jgi:hypothetical protein